MKVIITTQEKQNTDIGHRTFIDCDEILRMFQVTSTTKCLDYTNPSYSNALGYSTGHTGQGGSHPNWTRKWMIFRGEAGCILSRDSDIGWQKQIVSGFLTAGSFGLIQTRDVAAMFHMDLMQGIQFWVLTPRPENSVIEPYLSTKMTRD